MRAVATTNEINDYAGGGSGYLQGPEADDDDLLNGDRGFAHGRKDYWEIRKFDYRSKGGNVDDRHKMGGCLLGCIGFMVTCFGIYFIHLFSYGFNIYFCHRHIHLFPRPIFVQYTYLSICVLKICVWREFQG